MKTRNPKILLFDLETTPITGYTWGLYEQNVIAISKEWHILSVGYKWAGESKVTFIKGNGHDDKVVTRKLHRLFNQADIVVAHNGASFDLKKARARFIKNGLPPNKPVAVVDTLRIARSQFAFTSNKLDDLAAFLGVGRKVRHTGIDVWLGCMASRNSEHWATMEKYNCRDVELLEGVYNKLKKWMPNHPNLSLLKGGHKDECPLGHKEVICRGYRGNSKSLSRQMYCKTCPRWYLAAMGKRK